MRPGGRNPTSDFVQDYAAKRQAQLDRAKAIRQERLQQQQSAPSTSPPHHARAAAAGGEAYEYDSRARAGYGGTAGGGPSTPVHTSSAAHASAHANMLYVSEDDFKRATQAGVITPDQARQLWAILSNQIIRVGPNSQTATTSVNSLLALSHFGASSGESSSSLSSSGRSSKAQSGGFGGSVSISALRHSIARFKETHQQQQPPQHNTSGGGVVPSSSASSSPHIMGGHKMREDDFDDRAPSMRGPGGPHARGTGSGAATGARGPKKPAWNSDVDVDLAADANAYDPLPSMPNPEDDDDGSFGRRAARPPAPRVAKKTTAAAKPKAAAAASNPAVRPAVPAMAMGSGVGASVGLDDVPVGRGQTSAMNDWSNAYPPGMAPPSRGGVGASLSNVRVGGSGAVSAAEINEQIAAESAAAAAEPLRECAICGRRFRQSLLARHEAVCKKNSKPRRTFDMRAQRADGVEGLVQAQREAKSQQRVSGRAGAGAGSGGAAAGKIPKWKLQHEQFQAAMKAVQQVDKAGGFGSGALLPPPPSLPAALDDRVPCPHCGRKFADEVAKRHIPKCATTVAKPKGIRPIRR